MVPNDNNTKTWISAKLSKVIDETISTFRSITLINFCSPGASAFSNPAPEEQKDPGLLEGIVGAGLGAAAGLVGGAVQTAANVVGGAAVSGAVGASIGGET